MGALVTKKVMLFCACVLAPRLSASTAAEATVAQRIVCISSSYQVHLFGGYDHPRSDLTAAGARLPGAQMDGTSGGTGVGREAARRHRHGDQRHTAHDHVD